MEPPIATPELALKGNIPTSQITGHQQNRKIDLNSSTIGRVMLYRASEFCNWLSKTTYTSILQLDGESKRRIYSS
jgi:hypothetical protein